MRIGLNIDIEFGASKRIIFIRRFDVVIVIK